MVTDPATYNNRDLLLFLQLLHTNGLIEPSSITENPEKLRQISQEWFYHKSTKLSMVNGLDIASPWEVDQMVKLYDNLLQKYGGNTTTMANAIYSERIQELESKLGDAQGQFDELIKKPI